MIDLSDEEIVILYRFIQWDDPDSTLHDVVNIITKFQEEV